MKVKKIALFTMIVMIHSLAAAQTGIFKTYEDFLSNNVIEYKNYSYTHHTFGNFKVAFIDNDDKTVIFDLNKESIWGYRKGDGNILRVDKRNNPNVIIMRGDIVTYGNYSTKISNDGFEMKSNQFFPQISLGLNGEMIRLTKKNLRKMLKDDFSALQELKKTSKNIQALFDFVLRYNG
ncbi:MAG: hypothetical protein ACI94Y_000329 [Maribacter sp.]|jgi:hypothetical protein